MHRPFIHFRCTQNKEKPLFSSYPALKAPAFVSMQTGKPLPMPNGWHVRNDKQMAEAMPQLIHLGCSIVQKK